MKENVLIQSKPCMNHKVYIAIILLTVIFLTAFMLISLVSMKGVHTPFVYVPDDSVFDRATKAYAQASDKNNIYCDHVFLDVFQTTFFSSKHNSDGGICPLDFPSSTVFALYISFIVFLQRYGILYLGILLILTLFIIYFRPNNQELVVTDKRVYGRTVFGKRVDLPIDSISAVGTQWLKGITVLTSSGKIAFLLIRNNKEIHSEISKLLCARQEEKNIALTPNLPIQLSDADELKKFKDLLDSGVITQEEFDAKKKQLLGL